VSLGVRFEAEAAVEVQEAAAWYELQRPGLGLAFLAAIDRAVGHVADWPDPTQPCLDRRIGVSGRA
jgi:hypothetical protein